MSFCPGVITYQPQSTPIIDRDNPLSRGLTVALLPQNINRFGSIVSTVSVGRNRFTAIEINSGDSGYISLNTAAPFGELTLGVVTLFKDLNATTFADTANNTGAVIYSQRTLDTSISPTFCVTNSTFAGNNMRFWAGSDTSATAVGSCHSEIITTDRIYAAAARFGAAGAGLPNGIAVNGSFENAVYTQVGVYQSNWTGDAVVGSHLRWPSSPRDNANQQIFLFVRWNRYLTEAEMREFTRNPWQIFAPTQRRIWDIPASSGVSGNLVYTNINDVLAGLGTSTILGTLSRTNVSDVLSSAGTTQILGTFSRTNLNDTLNAAGSVGAAVSGTFSRTNNNDVLAGIGTTQVLGTFTRNAFSDVLTATGTITVTGMLSRTNTSDVMNASGFTGAPPEVSTRLALTNVGK